MNNLNFSNIETVLRKRLQKTYERDMPAIFGAGDFITIRTNSGFHQKSFEVSISSLSTNPVVDTWTPVEGHSINERRVKYIELTPDDLSKLIIKYYMEVYE